MLSKLNLFLTQANGHNSTTDWCLTIPTDTFDINRLFAYFKGGNVNIHIWAWLVIASPKEGKTGFIIILVKNFVPHKRACIL